MAPPTRRNRQSLTTTQSCNAHTKAAACPRGCRVTMRTNPGDVAELAENYRSSRVARFIAQ